jgi:hypothetical protein
VHNTATWLELAESVRALAETLTNPVEREAVAAQAFEYEALASELTVDRGFFRFWGACGSGRW